MNTEMRKIPQLLALAVALGGTLALAACQPTSQSADTTAEQQTPPPAEPTPSAPSDVSGGSATTPAADAANTAPPTDAGAMPPASEPTPSPTDADKAASEPPKPVDEAKPEEEKK